MLQDIASPQTRDAYYETEDIIDHYLHNSNTPPFVSKLLIQHFGISNPSPRYIETVANSFKDGLYTWTDPGNGTHIIEFGEGIWGDLASTVAAIVLDREATTVVLDADPAHGSIREPWLKVVGMMRSLEYTRTDIARNQYPVLRTGMVDIIGQAPYEVSVFCFVIPSAEGRPQLSVIVVPNQI